MKAMTMTESKRNSLLLVLSLAAGCVDAAAFVNTGAFPANMTGNSVMLGLALAHANTDHAGLSFLALLGFCAGVIGSAWFMPSADGERKWTRALSAVFFAAGLLLLASVSALMFLDLPAFSWLIVPLAIAMGMQSAAVLRLGVAGISTTVITGTLTTALVRLTGKMRKNKKQEMSGKGPWLPLLSWTAYLAGALVGGIQSVWQADWILLLPGALLVGVAFWGGLGRQAS